MPDAIFLNELGVVSALGSGLSETRAALFGCAPCGVAEWEGFGPGPLHLGKVTAPLVSTDTLPPEFRSRNNALLLTALAQIRSAVDAAVERFGPHRVGVVLGTSTSGIGDSEVAFAHHRRSGHFPSGFTLAQQELGSPALALTTLLGLHGPSWVVSTACSSSAKAMASAARLLESGLCDAVLTGGADSLCRFTVAGFSSLDSVSASRCNPMSVHRRGINLGEAAALFLMTKQAGGVQLQGFGESSDAHHVSAPEPTGRCARVAILQALARAGLKPNEVDYVNLHGTATVQNDAMESLVVHGLFGHRVHASSTKPLSGHTLGTAGALEAAFCFLALTDNEMGALPPHWWDGQRDTSLPHLALVAPGETLGRPLRHALSTSFAFGGSNAALLLGSVR